MRFTKNSLYLYYRKQSREIADNLATALNVHSDFMYEYNLGQLAQLLHLMNLFEIFDSNRVYLEHKTIIDYAKKLAGEKQYGME